MTGTETIEQTDSGEDDFLSAMRKQYEGAELGPVRHGRFPVNEPMIAHWCDAIEDRNPIYVDPESAKESIHGAVVAPPAMLQVWIMPGLAPRPQDKVEDIKAEFRERGFTSVVATNSEQEFFRYLRPGDKITARGKVESISDEKATGLGRGHFVTSRTTLYDQDDEPVGTLMFRVLCFAPGTGKSGKKSDVETETVPEFPFSYPAVNEDTEFFWDALRDRRFLIQRCASCGDLRHPPGPMCPSCQSLEWDTVTATGRGSLYSYVVFHHPLPAGVTTPYIVGLIELEEGTRFVANVVGIEPHELSVGLPVELECIDIDDELTIPRFRPA